ncbi:MAG: SDR family oxidoreductase [Alphaproteobacteria bacterium]
MTDQTNTLLILGLGYTARLIASKAQQAGFVVVGTARTPSPADKDVLRFDDTVAVAAAINSATHILSSVPPAPDHDPVLSLYGDAIKSSTAKWVGYLSTTGVYGNTDGAWVDETSPCAPSSPRAARRVRDEQAWADHTGDRLTTFRIAGIYGPGRSPLDQLTADTARRIDKPGHAFGRIHVEDIANAVVTAMQQRAHNIYNLCDDEPAAPADVTAFAADLLGITPPPLVAYGEANLSDMAKTFWMDNRRVRNDRLKNLIGGTLLYPTYREGLIALSRQAAPQQS